MSVYRVIDVIGTSTQTWEDAAVTAVNTARKSLRDLRVAEVVAQDLHVEDSGEVVFRTKLRLSYTYEDPAYRRPHDNRAHRAPGRAAAPAGAPVRPPSRGFR